MKQTALYMLLQKHKTAPREIAKHLGIPKCEVKKWCRGIGFPDVWQAVKISKLINCDLKDLYLAILRTGH